MSLDELVDESKTRTWADVAKIISDHMTAQGEWCGMPIPLPGLGLVLESKHPMADKIAEITRVVNFDRPPRTVVCSTDAVESTIVNHWRSVQHGGRVYVVRSPDGRVHAEIAHYAPLKNELMFGPLDAMDAWNLDTELTAMQKLATLLPHRMFKAYMLTGMFIETSKRSGIHYIFRRCRPTLALSSREHRNQFTGEEGSSRILTALCLHPIGYYTHSFAGAMTPTDDIIAHLLLMRGDEHLFWRRANQHHPCEPEAGL